jgi:O-antigen/teichoic acid export membrane protein
MLDNLSKLLHSFDEHIIEVIKKSSSSLLVKLSGMLIGLAVSIALGRLLGAEGFGIINLATRIVAVIMILGMLGIPQVIIKEVSIGRVSKDWEHVGNVMHTSYLLCGLVTVLFSVLFILLAPWISTSIFKEERLTFPLIIALVVMTPQVFSRLFSSGLVGYRKIWQSNLVDQTLSAAIVGILLAILYSLNFEITINRVAILYAIGRIVVTFTMLLYWRKLYPYRLKRTFIKEKILKTSMPLMIVSASYIVSTSIDGIMVGWLSNAKQVGLFAIGLKLALLTSFLTQITTSVLTPKIAEMYHSGKVNEMQFMIQKVTRILLIIGIIVLAIIVVFGKYILGLWGADFVEAYWILVVLGIGQFFTIASGPVGNLLAMTDHEKILKNIMISTLLINVVLNFFFITYYDALGAAMATAITIGLNMVLCTIIVKRKLNFIPILGAKSIFKK